MKTDYRPNRPRQFYRYRPEQYRTVYVSVDKLVFWAVMIVGVVVLICGY